MQRTIITDRCKIGHGVPTLTLDAFFLCLGATTVLP